MKILNKIAFYVFFAISFLCVMSLFVINDIEPGGLGWYVLYVCCIFASILVAVLLYNYRIVTRHFFAARCVAIVIYGAVHNIRSRRYDFLYDAMLKTGSISKFYSAMLCLYDVTNEGVETLSEEFN